MIVGDDVCSDVALTSSLPPVTTISLPWLKRLPGKGFMTLSSIWPIRGVQRKPLSEKASLCICCFSRDPSWKWSLHQGSSILRGGVFRHPSPASCSHSADCFPCWNSESAFCLWSSTCFFLSRGVWGVEGCSRVWTSCGGPGGQGMRTRGEAPLGPPHRRGPGLDCASCRRSSVLFPPLASGGVKQRINPVTLPSWEVLQKGPS